MPERKKALGRGLAALLPNSDRGLQQLSIADIATNPQQPRQRFDEAALADLVASIRQHGIIQPLVVAPIAADEAGHRYRLVVGERRLRAAALAGLDSIPALIRDVDSRESLEIALIENLQRQDLNPVEEAQAYQDLMLAFNLTQEEVAQRVGRSRSAVANSLRLLRLPEGILELLRQGRLSEGHARALLALPSEAAMCKLAEEIMSRGLSVRETEAAVAHLQAAAQEPKATDKRPHDPLTESLEEGLRLRLGTKVSLRRGRRGGRLVIHFYSDEELDSIYHAIVGES